MKLGDLEFSAEDLNQAAVNLIRERNRVGIGYVPLKPSEHAKALAPYLNQILREKLEQAPIVFGNNPIPCEINGIWFQFDSNKPGKHNNRQARLVCIEEIGE